MTPSTTNTAARELLELIDRYWDLAYAEGKEGRTHDTEAGDAQQCRHEIESRIATLPQQQGGEQEALEYLAREYERRGFNASAANVRSRTYPGYQEAHDIAVHAITAALRTKQPAASEGDGYLDKLCHVVHALTGDEGEDDPLTVLERYAANGAKLDYPDAANTSKQAAGEGVATVCLRGDTYAHGLFTELQVQHKEGVTFPIGTKFYLAPRHPADEGMARDVLCIHCGRPTMHIGNVCFTCSKAAKNSALAGTP